jgi:heme o synthase
MRESMKLKAALENVVNERFRPDSQMLSAGLIEKRTSHFAVFVSALFRLARPGIMALVALAGTSGMVLASRGAPDAGALSACLISMILAASGSAMINAVIEHSRDRKMDRLRARVAAVNTVGRWQTAALGTILTASAIILAFRLLPSLSACLTAAAVAGYLLLYTACLKHRSPFAAIPGALPGALPVLIGYSSAGMSIGPDGLILFLLLLFWQPAHFWILSLRYREEYNAAGFPTLSNSFGGQFALAAIFLYASSLVPISLTFWVFGYSSAFYALAAFLLGVTFLHALHRLMVRNYRPALAFRLTNWYLAALLILIIVDAVI